MKVNIKPIIGNWDLGYSLDKHVLKCNYTGENEWGHATFDTTRSEAGEALYQLKYRYDYNQIPIICSQMFDSFSKYFSSTNIVIPMVPSIYRERQPVTELSQLLAKKMGILCIEDLLKKTTKTSQMKDIDSRDEKIKILIDAFSVNKILVQDIYNVLIVDDLFDTGSSLEAATTVLRSYTKIRNIFVATITRKN